MLPRIASVTLALAIATPLTAVPITFNLRDTSATAEIEGGSITRGGVTATLSPLVSNASGTLNQTSTGFGINASGSGDDTDQLDGVNGAESISIQFSQTVLFTGLTISDFFSGASDQASLSVGAFGPLNLTDTGFGADVFTFAANNLVLSSGAVLLQFAGGNGFSFDSFTIETESGNSVPDHGPTAALFLLTSVGIVVYSRRSGIGRKLPS